MKPSPPSWIRRRLLAPNPPSRKVCPECHRGELKYPGECGTCGGRGSVEVASDGLLAQHLYDTTPPARGGGPGRAAVWLVVALALVVGGAWLGVRLWR